jgi:hypothetical protein
MLVAGLLLALLLAAAIGFAMNRAFRGPPGGLEDHAPTGSRRALRIGLAALWLAFTALFALAFYDRYWRWRGCFNELGRCYDPDEGVMLEQAGGIWGGLALIFGLLLVRSLWGLLRQRTAR